MPQEYRGRASTPARIHAAAPAPAAPAADFASTHLADTRRFRQFVIRR
jgi:hypothetical protein